MRTIQQRLHEHASPTVPPSLNWKALDMENIINNRPKRTAATWARLAYHLAILALLLVRCGPRAGGAGTPEYAIDVLAGYPDIEISVSLADCSNYTECESLKPPLTETNVDRHSKADALKLAADPVQFKRSASNSIPPIQPFALPEPLRSVDKSPLYILAPFMQPVTMVITPIPRIRLNPLPSPPPVLLEVNSKSKIIRTAPVISLIAGSVWYDVLQPERESATRREPLPGFATSLRYRPAATSVLAPVYGISYQHYRYVARAEGSWRANAHSPGSLDTIYRNLTTGEETYAFTDSLPAQYNYRFGNTNTHRLITIAAGISAQTQHSKFNLIAAAGAGATYRLGSSGREVVTVPVSEPLVATKDRFSFGLYGEVGLGYQLTSTWNVTLTARGQILARNVLENRLVDELVRSYGVGLGVQYRLR